MEISGKFVHTVVVYSTGQTIRVYNIIRYVYTFYMQMPQARIYIYMYIKCVVRNTNVSAEQRLYAGYTAINFPVGRLDILRYDESTLLENDSLRN